MNKIKLIASNNLFVLLIVMIELILVMSNYIPNTFFLGWDNLFPELNFLENIKRSFFGVWQENRGLGLLDGMSFSANIVHYNFLYLVSFILPISSLRYFFLFSMHLLGGLGIYVLLRKNILPRARLLIYINTISFIGAFFYMFNLITVQMFYAPYELFLIHFAFLPWLTHYLIEYLENPKSKNLLKFSLFSFLSISQAHVPTIFVTYILFISTILLMYSIKNKSNSLRKIITIGLVIFGLNAFWGLPFGYSSLSNSGIIVDAKINQLSNENIYLKNKARGGFLDVLYFRGFLLDEIEVSKDGNFNYIMPAWRDYSSNPLVITIVTLIVLIIFVGIYKAFVMKDRLVTAILISYLVFFILLATDTPIAREITEFLRDQNSIFREIFRFSFTKFSIIFSLCSVILFSLGLAQIISSLRRKELIVIIRIFLAAVIVLLAVYSFPSFKGNFFYKELKVNIPDEYNQITDYLKTQNVNTRIATLPQPTFWSWLFYRWGGRGSGFLWFGIPQPMMERAFDPWSDKNENYYWELSYALYSNNSSLLKDVLEKYHIQRILLDKNLYNPLSYRSLFFEETEDHLSQTGIISLEKKAGNLFLYRVNIQTKPVNNIIISENIENILPEYKWNNFDPAYKMYGLYKSDSSDPNSSIYYPFRSLFTGKNPKDVNLEIEDVEDSVVFKADIPQFLQNHRLEIPDLNQDESLWIDGQNLNDIGFYLPKTNVASNFITVEILKKDGYFGKKIDPTEKEGIAQAKKCEDKNYPDETEDSLVKNDILSDGNSRFLRLTSVNAKNCSASYWIPNLSHKLSYLVKIRSRNIEGKGISFWVENTTNKKSDIESYLPESKEIATSYFVLPPMEKDGLGYSFHFDNISIDNFKTVNDIVNFEILPIPYNYLATLYFRPENYQPVDSTYEQALNISHPNPFIYFVDLKKSKGERNIILSQSYHKGWLLFDSSEFPFRKINNHFIVNNWANGWGIDKSTEKVLIFFWPQLLEFLGFGIMVITVGALIVVKIRSKN